MPFNNAITFCISSICCRAFKTKILLRIFIHCTFTSYTARLKSHKIKLSKKPEKFLHNRVCYVSNALKTEQWRVMESCVLVMFHSLRFRVSIFLNLVTLPCCVADLSLSLSLFFHLSPQQNIIHNTAHLSETLSRSISMQTCNISLFFLQLPYIDVDITRFIYNTYNTVGSSYAFFKVMAN